MGKKAKNNQNKTTGAVYIFHIIKRVHIFPRIIKCIWRRSHFQTWLMSFHVYLGYTERMGFKICIEKFIEIDRPTNQPTDWTYEYIIPQFIDWYHFLNATHFNLVIYAVYKYKIDRLVPLRHVFKTITEALEINDFFKFYFMETVFYFATVESETTFTT